LELTFDTGFTRPLSHTQYPSSRAQQVRGPQPETVRDLRVEAWLSGAWRPVAALRGNYQRKRVLKLVTPVQTQALRFVVEATHSGPPARIYEIRAYPPAR
jgi:hypothetical protein